MRFAGFEVINAYLAETCCAARLGVNCCPWAERRITTCAQNVQNQEWLTSRSLESCLVRRGCR